MPDPTPRLVGGEYRLGDLVLPRVSAVLSVLARPELERWRLRVGADEAERVSRAAAAHGTAVHAALARVADGVRVGRGRAAVREVPARFAGVAAEYLAWLTRAVARVVAVERVVWHPKERYAGTVDLLVRLRDGRLAVVDLKTGRRLSAVYRLQLAAYAEAVEAMAAWGLWGQGPALPAAGERVAARLVVHLAPVSPDATTAERQVRVVAYPEETDATDRAAWRACLTLYRWQAAAREAERGWQL